MESNVDIDHKIEVYSHPLTSAQKVNLLTALDRCDRCGGQAYFVASKEGIHSLMFCRHHYMKHSTKLVEDGFAVIDQSFMLEKQPDATVY